MAKAVLTHEKRAERGKKIAALFKVIRGDDDGAAIDKLARDFGLTTSTVRLAIRTNGNGIKIARSKLDSSHVKVKTFEILAHLIRTGSQTATAEKFKVSRQNVHQIKKSAEDAGLFDAIREKLKSGEPFKVA